VHICFLKRKSARLHSLISQETVIIVSCSLFVNTRRTYSVKVLSVGIFVLLCYDR
jgi:hypothetical protein